jgi:hypothetical protein
MDGKLLVQTEEKITPPQLVPSPVVKAMTTPFMPEQALAIVAFK